MPIIELPLFNTIPITINILIRSPWRVRFNIFSTITLTLTITITITFSFSFSFSFTPLPPVIGFRRRRARLSSDTESSQSNIIIHKHFLVQVAAPRILKFPVFSLVAGFLPLTRIVIVIAV
jgi:hypothetical protein